MKIVKTNNPDIMIKDEKITIRDVRPDPQCVTFEGYKDDEFIRFEFSHGGKFNIVLGDGITAVNHPAKIFFQRLEQWMPYEFKNAWYFNGKDAGIEDERGKALGYKFLFGTIGWAVGCISGFILSGFTI